MGTRVPDNGKTPTKNTNGSCTKPKPPKMKKEQRRAANSGGPKKPSTWTKKRKTSGLRLRTTRTRKSRDEQGDSEKTKHKNRGGKNSFGSTWREKGTLGLSSRSKKMAQYTEGRAAVLGGARGTNRFRNPGQMEGLEGGVANEQWFWVN